MNNFPVFFIFFMKFKNFNSIQFTYSVSFRCTMQSFSNIFKNIFQPSFSTLNSLGQCFIKTVFFKVPPFISYSKVQRRMPELETAVDHTSSETTQDWGRVAGTTYFYKVIHQLTSHNLKLIIIHHTNYELVSNLCPSHALFS